MIIAFFRAPMRDPWTDIKTEYERRRVELIEARNSTRPQCPARLGFARVAAFLSFYNGSTRSSASFDGLTTMY